MKKILFLGGLNSGGAEHQMVVMACLLKKRGFDVTYLCEGEGFFFQKDLEDARVPIIKIGIKKIIRFLRFSIPLITIKVYKILKNGKYDTVISFLGFWNFENCLFANMKGTSHRSITGIRNNREEVWLSKWDRFYTRFETNAHRKVSNSNAACKKFSRYFPEMKEKLVTIYNIVDLPTITTIYTPRRNGKTNIIVPASYRTVKNPMGMLEAIMLMKENDRRKMRIDWYGDIAAGKGCYEEMSKYINENQLSDIVILHNAVTKMANYVNEADMVGLFSKSEGLPNAVCEGMMLGKPIVMTRVSDYDVLAGNGNGILCDADNPQSIADALTNATRLTDEVLLKMGTISQEKGVALFSEEKVLRQWEEII